MALQWAVGEILSAAETGSIVGLSSVEIRFRRYGNGYLDGKHIIRNRTCTKVSPETPKSKETVLCN